MAKEELETNPFDSLHKTLVFSPRDWAFTSEDAWIYGIIVGWDNCKEFEKTFSWWTKKDTKRLKYMHSQFVKIAQENGSKFCTFDELEHLADLEKENAELKRSADNWYKYEKETQYHKDIIKDLKKENAELKEQNRSYEQLLETGSVTLMKDRLKNYKQLTKAKELLKHWANAYGGVDIALCKQTQQFLNEVKK